MKVRSMSLPEWEVHRVWLGVTTDLHRTYLGRTIGLKKQEKCSEKEKKIAEKCEFSDFICIFAKSFIINLNLIMTIIPYEP